MTAGTWVHYTADDGSQREGDVLETALDRRTRAEVGYLVRFRLGGSEYVPAEAITHVEAQTHKNSDTGPSLA